MPMIHIHVPAAKLSHEQKRAVIEGVTRAAVEAEGVPVTSMTWVLIHEIAPGGWGARGLQTDGDALPIVEIHTPVGWVGQVRKQRMIEAVARAISEAASVAGVHYVLVNEIADGGWGYQGRQIARAQYESRRAVDIDP